MFRIHRPSPTDQSLCTGISQSRALKRLAVEMDMLPLRREEDNGHLQLTGYGTVTLNIDYDDVLGTGGHGVVFRGRLVDLEGTIVKEVRVVHQRTIVCPCDSMKYGTSHVSSARMVS